VEKNDRYKSVISGREHGALPEIMRKALSGLSALYRVGVKSRNALYSKGWINRVTLPVPVISVGNITVGGTGKTPLVEYLARHLAESGKRALVLSRGYRTHRDNAMGRNDEAAVLDQNLPGVPHVQARNRVLAGLRAIKKHNTDCIVLDDGFQYRRLKRDLDIVVIDATNPFGYGELLPRGLLREPVESLERANAIVISKTDSLKEAELKELETTLAKYVAADRIFRAVHRTSEVYVPGANSQRRAVEIPALRNKRVFAFCGIGSPESFKRTVGALGCAIAGFRSYPDHYHYNNDAIAELRKQAADSGADVLITTQKDAVKLADADLGRELYVLRIAFAFVEGEKRFLTLVDAVL
jgi:tetraacyldisaccharide 4'-kinase